MGRILANELDKHKYFWRRIISNKMLACNLNDNLVFNIRNILHVSCSAIEPFVIGNQLYSFSLCTYTTFRHVKSILLVGVTSITKRIMKTYCE